MCGNIRTGGVFDQEKPLGTMKKKFLAGQPFVGYKNPSLKFRYNGDIEVRYPDDRWVFYCIVLSIRDEGFTTFFTFLGTHSKEVSIAYADLTFIEELVVEGGQLV